MLINFLNQNPKNYLFNAAGEAPKPVETVEITVNKTGKPDYKDKENRDTLYKQVEATIAKLKNSPAAKDLENSLKVAKKNDKMELVEPEEAANSLHDRLNTILQPASDKLSAQLAVEGAKGAAQPGLEAKKPSKEAAISDAEAAAKLTEESDNARLDAIAKATEKGPMSDADAAWIKAQLDVMEKAGPAKEETKKASVEKPKGGTPV